MFDPFGFGRGHYDYDGYGPDRSHWREKSDAASRREMEAKRLFVQFLEECKELDESSAFPTTKEVVPPQVHLTDACWKTFKQFCISKGCTTKRRTATMQERIDSKEKRKSKLYVISVTVPVHPTKVEEAKRVQQQKAKEAEEKRRLERERAIQAAKELKEQTEREYQAIVDSLDDDKKKDGDTKIPAAVLKEQDTNTNTQDDEVKPSPPKKLKTSSNLLSVSSKPRLVAHADAIHRQRLNNISMNISTEQRKEEQAVLEQVRLKMQNKKKKLQDEAAAHLAKIKSAIVAAA